MANSPAGLRKYNFMSSWNQTRDSELHYMQFITNRTSEYALLEGWLEFATSIPALEHLGENDLPADETFNSIATTSVAS